MSPSLETQGQVYGQFSRSQKKMGGGARYPYPKWVWTWFGGWWSEPANANKNAVVSVVIYSGALAALWSYSASIETRHHYPNRWIPSMLWGRDFHDPAFIAQWKEQLKATGRKWIEPSECI